MGAIDIEKLAQAVSEESPCGENLEYDPVFAAMERAAQGKPEQQYGDTVVPAEEPDWKEVRDQSLELLGRTKDLRAASYLVRALIRTDGLPGFRDGVTLIHRYLDSYWEGIHPQLDPEDDNDPTIRINSIVALSDPHSTLTGLRESPLVSSRTLGRFGLRDILVAKGEMPAPTEEGYEIPEMSAIEAAFLDCELEELQATAEAVDQSLEQIAGIEALLMEKVGPTNAPDINALPEVLRGCQIVLREQLARRGVGEAAAAGEEGAAGEAAAISGEIRSREDVIRVLDRACDYFNRYEPSSPVPLLLQRAKKLVSKSFLDIIRDLAPDGSKQVENIAGVDKED
jgi:type VI secretion system protein ImpA